jgi:drug/metabolite transporter (DMT)-like permease
MGKNARSHIAVLIANLIYGANYSIAKLVMPAYVKPFGLIVVRVWVAAILFTITARAFGKEKIDPKDHVRLLLCAVFGVGANQLLFFKGLSLTSPINSGLIMVTNPIFVLILSAIILGERMNARRIFGIISGLSGAVLLILFGQHHAADAVSSPLGDTFVLLNAISFGVYLVMVKPLMVKYHPFTILMYIFCAGAILVLPFGLTELSQVEWASFPVEIWLSMGFVVIGTTFFAYLLNTTALKNLSPSVVSIYIYLQPLLACFFAILMGKDRPGLIHLASAILIFTGVYLSTIGSTSASATAKR